LDNLPPWNWVALFRNLRNTIIFQICSEWARNPTNYFPISEGNNFLTYQIFLDGSRALQEGELLNGFVPYLIDIQNGVMSQRPYPALRNAHTEADQAVVFYMSKLLQPGEKGIVLSDDTDVLMNLLLLTHTKFAPNAKINWGTLTSGRAKLRIDITKMNGLNRADRIGIIFRDACRFIYSKPK